MAALIDAAAADGATRIVAPRSFVTSGTGAVDGIAGALQCLAGVAADVPGAPGHEDRGAISGQWRNT